MIKVVIFDLGSVLVGDEWLMIYRIITDKTKLPLERVTNVVKSLFKKWSLGRMSENDFWTEFKMQTGVSLPENFTKDFFLKTYKELSKDIRETWDILSELKAEGLRLALLSNIIEPHILANEEMGRLEKLRDLGFETFVWSCKEGVGKPDQKIYKIMLQKLNLPAEACVYIDDKPENVEVAQKLRMYGIRFQTPEQLRKELNELDLFSKI